MKEPYTVITFNLKDLKVLQESICKLYIDYSSSVKLGHCLAEHSGEKQHVIEIKMEIHNVKLKILGECSQKVISWDLAEIWEVQLLFPHNVNWGLNRKAQKCIYGLYEKLQLQGQAICWDAG